MFPMQTIKPGAVICPIYMSAAFGSRVKTVRFECVFQMLRCGWLTRKAPMLSWPVCARAAKSEESCMAKGRREKIKLESSAGSGHISTTTKNKRIKPDKIKLMKLDPSTDVRKNVLYTETKLK